MSTHPSALPVTLDVGQVTGGLVSGIVTGPVHIHAAGPAAPHPAGATPPTSPSAAPDRAAELAARVTVGIITALPKELAAVKTMLDEPVEHDVGGHGAGRQYWLGEVPGKGGATHAVAVAMSGMGNTQAAARATLLLEHFPLIDAILMVGIAGAVPHPRRVAEHVRLGDIVVSDRLGVIQYDFVKETAAVVEHRHAPRPPSARLLEADAALQLLELEGSRPWEDLLARAHKLPRSARPSVADVLRDSDEPDRIVPHPDDPDRTEGHPRVFRGPIASSHVLLKNPRRRDLLRDTFGVKAVEMEGSGIADATWMHEAGYFVVRGTCDYCDAQKSDTWHSYAAAIAAAYARALVGCMRVSIDARRAVPLVSPLPSPQASPSQVTGAHLPPAQLPPPPAPAPRPVHVAVPVSVTADVVYLSAPVDEEHRTMLARHLRPLLRRLTLTEWHRTGVSAGTDAAAELDSAIRSARVVLLLVTPDYLVDDACRAAERAAMARVPDGLRVIPVSVRTVADWSKEPFGQLAHLPRGNDGKAVAEWRSKDEAWADVARGVGAVLTPAAR